MKLAKVRSPWAVRVDMPVLGPTRCTSQMTRGISARLASPAYSVIRLKPGPEVEVIARSPPQPAPTAMPTAASSSSAWTTAYVSLPVNGSLRQLGKYSTNDSARLEAGVIGYQAANWTPP